MNRISNDFITIEYDSELGRETAEYYINLFNKEPEYFKGILNGRNTIHTSELPKLKDYDLVNRSNVIRWILEKNEATNTLFCDTISSIQGIYYGMMAYLHGNPTGADIKYTYHELAYDYLQMTGDFSYLKKYYFENQIDKNDLRTLCMYEAAHRYEELLKEKINDTKNAQLYPQIKDNISDIRKITEYIDNISTQIIQESKHTEKTKINEQEFERLVIGALNYIDPTNKLVEEYLEAKKEGHINFIYGKPNQRSLYHEERNEFYELIDWQIDIHMEGTLDDVRNLVHEFGHYHFRIDDKLTKKNNTLLREYPSIYFEHKAIEYLEKTGFSKEQISNVRLFRAKGNKSNISDFLPSLYCIEQNLNTKIGEYKIKEVDKYAKNYWEREYKKQVESSFPREKKRLRDVLLFFDRIRTLNRIDEDESNLIYIIGTYLAVYTSNNLSHERALEILEYIQHNKVDINKLRMLHEINDGQQPENEISKVKQKQVQ